jgi:hypothetical protein
VRLPEVSRDRPDRVREPGAAAGAQVADRPPPVSQGVKAGVSQPAQLPETIFHADQ